MPTYGDKLLGGPGQTTTSGAKSLNLTLASDEYPTSVTIVNSGGVITNNVQADNGYICYIFLSNTAGNNAHNIIGHIFYDRGSTWAPAGSASGSWTNLKGAALAIGFDSALCSMLNACTVTITTTKSTYAITINNSTGGTVTASATSGIISGTTITLYKTAAAGYAFSAWNTSPTVSINSSNQFSMPASNVTISPTWSRLSYAITTAVEPSGAGTVTAPSTGVYNNTITLSQSPSASRYAFSHYTVSGIGTLSGNTFTMPASAVTVTAHYSEVGHTITWSEADLTITQSGRFLTFQMAGTAVDNYGENIQYYLHKDGEPAGRFVNSKLNLKLSNEDNNQNITYSLVARSSIQSTGYTKTFQATFPVPNSDTCGYLDEQGTYIYVLPLYYTGTQWKECELKYYNGTSWLLAKTFKEGI